MTALTDQLARARSAFASGDYAQALDAARIAAATGVPEALVVYVNAATKLDALPELIDGLERLHATFPAHPQFARMLSTALNNRVARNASPDRRVDLERALALWPDNPDAHYNAAPLFAADGDASRTLAALERSDADAEHALEAGLALAAHGEVDAARIAHARAVAKTDGERRPGLLAAIANALTLPPVHDDRAHLDRARAEYGERLDDLIARYDDDRLARCDGTLDQLAWSNFLLAYQGCDDRALQSRYGDWVARAAAIFTRDRLPSRDGLRGRALPNRIALVSSFFRDTTVGAYFGRWIAALGEAGFETHVFQLGPRHDAVTERLARTASVLHRLDAGPLDDWAAAIADARASLVLYPELGMDARTFALAACRLAPVQAMAWGHPVTSGLPTIDAYFTAGAMEPDDAQSAYRERLVRLPGLGTAYTPPPPPAALTRAALGLPEDRTLYLVPQAAFKIHPDNDAVLARIVERDPRACVVLFDNERSGMTTRLRARLERRVPPDRLRFLPMTSRDRYLAINAACDVMVDTLHWSGGNTSLDAFAASLPVVTCRGPAMRSRQTAAMLERLSLSRELEVDTPTALADRAVDVANDAASRRKLVARIAAGRPALHAGDDALATLVAEARTLVGKVG